MVTSGPPTTPANDPPVEAAATTLMPAPSPKFAYLPTLDGWRAVAILLVVVAHGSDSILRGSAESSAKYTRLFTNLGYYGVGIFFALSGFLICSRLLHEQRTRGRISLKQFFGRRVFRILPAAVTYLVVLAVLAKTAGLPLDPWSWFETLFCLSNYLRPDNWYLGHFWSLAVEEHFYLLWPIALVLAATWRRGLAVAVSLAVAVTLWRSIDLKFFPPAGVYVTFEARTDLQADALLWGCVVAFLYVPGPMRDRLAKLLGGPGWFIVLAVLVASTLWEPADWKLRQVLLFVFRLLVPVVIVGTVLHPTRIVGLILESRPLVVIGRLSYSIYLWQQLFLTVANFRLPTFGAWQSFPLNLLGTAACATASYFLVEQPMLRLGHRVMSPRKPAADPSTKPAVEPVHAAPALSPTRTTV